jgi:hypothetical protein
MGVGNANAAIGAALWQTVLRQNIGKVVRISFTTLKVPPTPRALLLHPPKIPWLNWPTDAAPSPPPR